MIKDLIDKLKVPWYSILGGLPLAMFAWLMLYEHYFYPRLGSLDQPESAAMMAVLWLLSVLVIEIARRFIQHRWPEEAAIKEEV